jgi:hypothetical protein
MTVQSPSSHARTSVSLPTICRFAPTHRAGVGQDRPFVRVPVAHTSVPESSTPYRRLGDHPDHVNGLLGADDKPAFPNAEILVPAAEHKFWMDDGEMSRTTPGRMQGLFKDNRRVTKILFDFFAPAPSNSSLARCGRFHMI